MPTSRPIPTPTKSRPSTAKPATPIRPPASPAVSTPRRQTIPAQVATASHTTSTPEDDPRSNVYPLNVPKTCGTCHGSPDLAKKHGLPNVYPLYMDSIHGFALSKEGLLVAANCQSCHGSHNILSHTNPQSPTYKSNIPKTCGTCHAKIVADYEQGVHGKAVAGGNLNAPVCSDCHTAHAILQPTESAFRMQSTPICGNCHKDKFSTYRDTFHSQLGSLGGYVETARCWDCHGAHDVRPASDPTSPINKANLVTTCGRCHAGANLNFVQYQPHANARDRKLSLGSLFRAVVYEPAPRQRAHLLHDSHYPVAHPLPL